MLIMQNTDQIVEELGHLRTSKSRTPPTAPSAPSATVARVIMCCRGRWNLIGILTHPATRDLDYYARLDTHSNVCPTSPTTCSRTWPCTACTTASSPGAHSTCRPAATCRRVNTQRPAIMSDHSKPMPSGDGVHVDLDWSCSQTHHAVLLDVCLTLHALHVAFPC